jgi:hypothetical protein
MAIVAAFVPTTAVAGGLLMYEVGISEMGFPTTTRRS